MATLTLFKRPKAQINDIPIADGQVLVASDTENLEVSIDVDNLTRKKLIKDEQIELWNKISRLEEIETTISEIQSAVGDVSGIIGAMDEMLKSTLYGLAQEATGMTQAMPLHQEIADGGEISQTQPVQDVSEAEEIPEEVNEIEYQKDDNSSVVFSNLIRRLSKKNLSEKESGV